MTDEAPPFLITLELEGPPGSGPGLSQTFVSTEPLLGGFEKDLTILGMTVKLRVRFDPPLVPVELEVDDE